ncbi:hypothetical protein EJ110_NYTH30259 [Nymphaea thermarum]|nr:hypothetical protein EJ110_NYTH30259 [Nymphaea thermarum]
MQQPIADEEGGFRQSSRSDGLLFKRGHRGDEEEEKERRSDPKSRPRSHHHHIRGRRGERFDRLLCCFQSRRRSVVLFTGIAAVAVVFILAETFILQRTLVGRGSTLGRFGGEWNMIVGEPSKYLSSATRFVIGKNLRFEPGGLQGRLAKRRRLHPTEEHAKFGIRPPRLAIVLGGDEVVSSTLKLLSIANGLKFLGYKLTVYAVKEADMHKLWEKIGCQVSILDVDIADNLDWTNFEGIILSSLAVKAVVPDLMQEPFSSIPLVWIVEDGTLGRRLTLYEEAGWKQLVEEWRNTFSRADAIVFPNFRFPLLYNKFDNGNFFVIPGSPVDVLAAEKYLQSHSRDQLRAKNGFYETDLIVTVIGSSLFYNGLPLDYSPAMHSISPLLMKLAKTDDVKGSFKFIFLSGNSSDGTHDAFQEIASTLGFPDGYMRHYGMDVDVDGILLMSNVVLYGSFQDEQDFPPLLIRAMTFKRPIVAPNLTVIKAHVVDQVHGLIFDADNPDTLTTAFSRLVSNGKMSELSHVLASYGWQMARNMLASKCIGTYAELLENVIQFPSYTLMAKPFSELSKHANEWKWDILARGVRYSGNEHHLSQNLDQDLDGTSISSVVYTLEEEWQSHNLLTNASGVEAALQFDMPTQHDWHDLADMELSEESERLEMEEDEERTEKVASTWEDVHQNVRKVEKIKFETNERDEGELERIGQPLCIYEIYWGQGAWKFLHHGSLYRGLSLSSSTRRLVSDDVDAVGRLPFLNNTYFRDLLCETGGMFSIANHVDDIHKIPWIGFQSWHATGRKVSLSAEAEQVLEKCINTEPKGDMIYFWARNDMDNPLFDIQKKNLDFWSMCDVLNGGNCRHLFEKAFRHMYGLPLNVTALPPMPFDGGYWSILHSWVMPTRSFMEFVMFSRMFTSSLDVQNHEPERNWTCLLGTSEMEKKHCYCHVLELLVNVWAYHSARKMIYINPKSGVLEEQHPIEGRDGLMWAKYFNFTLLKAMDEDLAEEADDGDHPNDRWLWPLTGEVFWQGIYEREREERYRQKMEKKRRVKEKLLERQKHGYKQKSLGG